MPTASDVTVRAFRSWFKNDGQGQPRWAVGISDSNSDSSVSSSGDLTREALLERYHSHTKHCKSCREALAAVQKVSTSSSLHSHYSCFVCVIRTVHCYNIVEGCVSGSTAIMSYLCGDTTCVVA
jgi:hypothetical protein